MPFDEKDLPKWDSAGAEPPDSKKISGFGPGDKPPADWFNWLFNKSYKALQNLFVNAQNKDEKGKKNGYAALDANGKVINADGTQASGVQSVNNKTGVVNLNASDVGTYSKAEIDAFSIVSSINGKTGAVTLSAKDINGVNSEDYAKLRIDFIDLAIETETIKAGTLTGVNANIFIETFQNLDDVILEHGGYDSVNKRLEV